MRCSDCARLSECLSYLTSLLKPLSLRWRDSSLSPVGQHRIRRFAHRARRLWPVLPLIGASRVAVGTMTSIQGLIVTPLRRIPDERGAVLHMLRDDSSVFDRFGEIYFSTVYPGVIKAWHLHKEMTLNYAVPVGMIKLVCYDNRTESQTRGNLVELHVGELNYCLVTIPPLVWNGFKGEGTALALVANCASVHHSPEEIERLDPVTDQIPYDWALQHG